MNEVFRNANFGQFFRVLFVEWCAGVGELKRVPQPLIKTGFTTRFHLLLVRIIY